MHRVASELQVRFPHMHDQSVNTEPLASAATASLAPTWVFVFMALLGFVASLAAIAYVFKSRQNALALVKGIGGGGIASTVVAGLGAQIGGIPLSLSWLEAVIFTGVFFLLGLVVWGGLGVTTLYFLVMRPLQRRYGKSQASRAWVEFATGATPFGKWIEDIVGNPTLDNMWDEFACASLQLHTDLQGAPAESGIVFEYLTSITRKAGGPPQERTGGGVSLSTAIRLVRSRLEKPVEVLAARLTTTNLNFTVWRVHPEDDVLEHLASFPVEAGHEAGMGSKRPLKIWSDDRKTKSGSLAGEALLRREYLVLRSEEIPRHWEQRGLGRDYEAVGCMPIPCDGPSSSPWGAVCVEIRGGRLPLESNSMRRLAAQIARTIQKAGSSVSARTIDDTRALQK